jgi:hypothetical protein
MMMKQAGQGEAMGKWALSDDRRLERENRERGGERREKEEKRKSDSRWT